MVRLKRLNDRLVVRLTRIDRATNRAVRVTASGKHRNCNEHDNSETDPLEEPPRPAFDGEDPGRLLVSAPAIRTQLLEPYQARWSDLKLIVTSRSD